MKYQILILFLMLIPMSVAFGQIQTSIVVTTDKPSYSEGETILITGEVRDLYSDTPVSVIIKTPNGNLVSIQSVTVDSDKKFRSQLDAGGSLMKTEGMYTVTAQYGTPNRSATTTFQFGESTSHPSPTGSVTIEAAKGSGAPGCEQTSDGCYIPNTVTVGVGDTIIFSNTDNAAHTFTAGTPVNPQNGMFDSSLVMLGNTYEWTPTEAGEVPYFCMVHPWMKGLIIVGDEDSSGSTYIPFVPPKPVPSTDNSLKNENIQLQNRILFLEDEKDGVIKDNFKLKTENEKLKNDINFLESHIDELQNIINEQIKVILTTLLDLKK